MKIQKTQQYASIYLLTFLLFALLGGSGCAERSNSEGEKEVAIEPESAFQQFSSGLLDEKIEILANGTVSQSTWEYRYTDCQLHISEKIAYKRNKAPFGGFNPDTFLEAWESKRTIALADIDPALIKAEGPHLKLHTLAHKNLIKEENLYSEAYLAYYKAENGSAHPANSTFDYNLLTLFLNETSAPENVEQLKALITHGKAN